MKPKFNLYYINEISLSKSKKSTSVKLSQTEGQLSFLGVVVPYQYGVGNTKIWLSFPGDLVDELKAKSKDVAFEINERDIIDVTDEEGKSFGRTVSLEDITQVPLKWHVVDVTAITCAVAQVIRFNKLYST